MKRLFKAKLVLLGMCFLTFQSCAKKTFRDYAQKRNLNFGIALAAGDIYAEEESGIVKEHCSIVTSENCMKWESVRPNKTFWNWGDIDALVKFSEENGIKVKWHTFLWHRQNPPYVNSLKTEDEALSMLYEQIETVMARYKGRISEYDVANEIFEEDGSLRNNIWLKTAGESYVSKAFQKARECDPSAKLYLNDFNNECLGNAKADAMFNFVKSLKEQGVPIDGVGMQMHISTKYPWDIEAVRANVKRYADIGIEVSFSEVDVRTPVPASDADLNLQEEIYTSLMELALEMPNVKSFITWGISDKNSWIPFEFPGEGNALLWDSSLQKKSVYDSLLKILLK